MPPEPPAVTTLSEDDAQAARDALEVSSQTLSLSQSCDSESAVAEAFGGQDGAFDPWAHALPPGASVSDPSVTRPGAEESHAAAPRTPAEAAPSHVPHGILHPTSAPEARPPSAPSASLPTLHSELELPQGAPSRVRPRVPRAPRLAPRVADRRRAVLRRSSAKSRTTSATTRTSRLCRTARRRQSWCSLQRRSTPPARWSSWAQGEEHPCKQRRHRTTSGPRTCGGDRGRRVRSRKRECFGGCRCRAARRRLPACACGSRGVSWRSSRSGSARGKARR